MRNTNKPKYPYFRNKILKMINLGDNLLQKIVIDAQVLFNLIKTTVPVPLENLRKQILNKEIITIIPAIALAEFLWKMRRHNKIDEFIQLLESLKRADNVIIDEFDLEILELMIQNKESHELHDEIIAMTCKKHETKIIYTTDKKFEEIFGLELRSWK